VTSAAFDARPIPQSLMATTIGAVDPVSRGVVVVGLDQSEPGRAAVVYAAEVANQRRLPLKGGLHSSFHNPLCSCPTCAGESTRMVLGATQHDDSLTRPPKSFAALTPMLQRAAACKTALLRRRSSKGRSMQICS
jgi:hypothetical protein